MLIQSLVVPHGILLELLIGDDEILMPTTSFTQCGEDILAPILERAGLAIILVMSPPGKED